MFLLFLLGFHFQVPAVNKLRGVPTEVTTHRQRSPRWRSSGWGDTRISSSTWFHLKMAPKWNRRFLHLETIILRFHSLNLRSVVPTGQPPGREQCEVSISREIQFDRIKVSAPGFFPMPWHCSIFGPNELLHSNVSASWNMGCQLRSFWNVWKLPLVIQSLSICKNLLSRTYSANFCSKNLIWWVFGLLCFFYFGMTFSGGLTVQGLFPLVVWCFLRCGLTVFSGEGACKRQCRS